MIIVTIMAATAVGKLLIIIVITTITITIFIVKPVIIIK